MLLRHLVPIPRGCFKYTVVAAFILFLLKSFLNTFKNTSRISNHLTAVNEGWNDSVKTSRPGTTVLDGVLDRGSTLTKDRRTNSVTSDGIHASRLNETNNRNTDNDAPNLIKDPTFGRPTTQTSTTSRLSGCQRSFSSRNNDLDYSTYKNNGTRYIAVNPPSLDERRTGNQLFTFAAVLLVAISTNRRPVLHPGWLDDVFDIRGVHRGNVDTTRVEVKPRHHRWTCPCYVFDERHSLRFDERIMDLGRVTQKGILLNGYFQSWKYLVGIETELRCLLRFRHEIKMAAERYLEKNRSKRDWKSGSYARVGVHVRRGDLLKPHLRRYGYTLPTKEYFRSAVEHFRKQHSRVHLLVTSDDPDWTRTTFDELRSPEVEVTISVGNSAAVDFALLASSEAGLILSTGTFGWWAAWLANVTTVYYGQWPQPGSALDGHFERTDFFPPHWIPIS